LNDLPIKRVNGATLYVHDVAQVRDGFQHQQNIVRKDGLRASLLTILKSGSASTLDVVRRVKAEMPRILDGLTPELDVREFADQSLFVRAAISGVLKEGIIAASLTALMILLFIGSWRSTFIIALSIPLSVLSSIAILSALGETINLMTLGGLALAVGILVDDATVELENVHRQMTTGKPLVQAILDGAQEIALPAFVSTLCICIVFVPMFFLTGVARYLFVPLAEAVVFAMLASYILSRTLIPTLVMWFYRNVHYYAGHSADPVSTGWLRPFAAIKGRFERGFARFREGYRALLAAVLDRGALFGLGFLAFCFGSWLLAPQLGRDFFPAVDAGQSGSTCAPAAALASRRRPNWWNRWRSPSATKFRPGNWPAFSIILAFLPPASASAIAIAASWEPAMPTCWFRSGQNTPRPTPMCAASAGG